MKSYLIMMAVRLMEMRRILKDTGSVYLHCDPTASHYLKTLMDAIFGAGNFRSDIAWKRSSAHSDTRQGRQQHGRIHDVLLFYTTGQTWTWNPEYTPYDQDYIDRFYRHVDGDTGRRFTLGDIVGPGGEAKGNPRYEVMGVTRYWRYSQEKMQELIDAGRVVQTAPSRVPRYKRYLDEMPGVPLQDVWGDIGPVASQAAERIGYPTQKPLALLERVIRSSSNDGDVILDPFCGCATACVAAEKLGRQWVGIDLSSKAADLVKLRLRKEMGLFYDVRHRLDIPHRLDQEKVPNYRTHRHTLYGIQEGLVRRVPRHVPVPQHDGGSCRATVQGRHGPHDQPATIVWGLQFDEGDAEPGRIRRGSGTRGVATTRSTNMTTAQPKKPKRGRPENPKYQKTVHIDAPPKDVARTIMRKPPKPESEWRYLKNKPR